MEKRTRILDVSLELFVQHGLHATPVSKIIEAANVSNGTFFYYFKTKDDLISEIYNTIKEDIYKYQLDKIKEPVIVKKELRNIWMNWIIWAQENRSKFCFINLLSNTAYISSKSIKIDNIQSITKVFVVLSTIVKKGIEEEIIVDKNVDLLVLHIYTNIKSIIQYNSENQMSTDDLNELFNMLWRSIANF